MAERGYPELRPGARRAVPVDRPSSGSRLVDLAEEARVTKQAMMAIVDDLESRGYVRRIADPTDTRAKLVRLTTRGRTRRGRVPPCGAVRRATDEATLGDRAYERCASTRWSSSPSPTATGASDDARRSHRQDRRPERAPAEARAAPRPSWVARCPGIATRSCTCRTSTRTPPRRTMSSPAVPRREAVLRGPRGLGDRLEAVAGHAATRSSSRGCPRWAPVTSICCGATRMGPMTLLERAIATRRRVPGGPPRRPRGRGRGPDARARGGRPRRHLGPRRGCDVRTHPPCSLGRPRLTERGARPTIGDR